MITTDPVGEWHWDTAIDVSEGQGVRRAPKLFGELHSVAARLGVIDGWGRSGVKVATVDAPRQERYRWEGSGPVDRAVESDEVELGPRAMLHIWSKLPGEWLDEVAHRAENLFALRLVVWDQGGAMVSLRAYLDAAGLPGQYGSCLAHALAGSGEAEPRSIPCSAACWTLPRSPAPRLGRTPRGRRLRGGAPQVRAAD